MNALLEKFQGKLGIACFPTNQFGHQENTNAAEMLNSLRHVRPGGGFEPLADIYEKIEVNGQGAHPLYKMLKCALPAPSDPEGRDNIMGDPKFIIWSPVRRDDVAWNFEKFLVTAEGVPLKRYSRYFETIKIADDIQSLLGK